ncbi:putative ATP synthase F0, A subunit [Brevibacterium mcbrellneri ATCC 49030]|uniref:Putative ATP synthase F0, A subunit n=1 Tax=Brevibacterium mcbrellneri ATCC 49030 TaxID=585530 RepID=D4YLT3_9MICO|nr:FtsX-like permease family protein [Brevibacterium mcbrellneri]EFG47816.1 putative ATP synthase F0, A subunit [Brevibacterium mcbrellneri ATCC 49030]
MTRYIWKIFASDAKSWIPTIFVVAIVTALIGACINQFIWTNSSPFQVAAANAKLDPSEFSMVSVTIYILIAVVAVFTLTVIGAATVDRTRQTFSQWRLAGASPRQVRGGLWLLLGLSSVIGAVPGAVLGAFLSTEAVPLFNEMAAESFPDGTGNFSAPPFSPSAVATILSFLIGVVTCVAGAVVPARRASKVKPVEAIRGVAAVTGRHRVLRWIVGLIMLLIAVFLAFSSSLMPQNTDIGVEAGNMVNSAIMAGLVAAFGALLLGSEIISIVLGSIRMLLRPIPGTAIAQVAVKQANARATFNANMIAPLGAAVGLSVVMFTTLRSYQRTMAAEGFALTNPNYTDTALMTGLFCLAALLTSIAVICLSGRDSVLEQGALRTAGLTPHQVLALLVWQTFQLTVSTIIIALIPVLTTSAVLVARSTLIAGTSMLSIPLLHFIAAAFVCWLALFLVQWVQLAPWLCRSPAVSLRRA